MKAAIHATAIIEDGAKLAADVVVGPYCVIGPEVEIGAGTQLKSHVVVMGRTRIGSNNQIFPFASLGSAPQDLKYKGETSELIIGDHNVIREHATLNPGTETGGMLTKVGNHNLLMVGAHVAHDCQIGDHCILVNNATLAGHVVMEDYAILGGLSACHQFVRIGRHAMVGGMSGVEADVIPFGMVMGNRARLEGLNLVGLRRHQFPKEEINALRHAFDQLFAEEGTLESRQQKVEAEFQGSVLVGEVLAFLRAKSDRRFCMPEKRRG